MTLARGERRGTAFVIDSDAWMNWLILVSGGNAQTILFTRESEGIQGFSSLIFVFET